jgi:RNA polymerase sigma-70 factor (ECF subfamily)
VSTTDSLLWSPSGRREAPIDLTVRRAQRGDSDAFGQLYDAHAGRVHAVCLRLSGDPAEAAELVQDVFVRAWERLDSFRGESAFGTWLHRLAVNVVFQRGRAARRRRQRVAVSADLPHDPPVPVTPGHGPGLAMDLERAVALLPDQLRQVFVLHDVEGFQHAEIAAALGLPVGTCRSHLFRARRHLREALS